MRIAFNDRASGFAAHGLSGVGLEQTGAVERTPDVCGGAARIAGARIPVWQLVEARDLGASEAHLLLDLPRLRAADLVAAWAYADAHPEEIAADLLRNEVA